ncbi:MAG: hypothetical protein ACXWR1_04425 [Bdellovibrionota bacterium]
MKLTALLILAIAPSAFAAKLADKKVFEAWYLMKKGEKASSSIHESVSNNAKEGSSNLRQSLNLFGKDGALVTVETASLNDEKMTPSWMESVFKSRDGKTWYKRSIKARMNGRFTDAEITVEHLSPKLPTETKTDFMPKDGIFYSSIPRLVAKQKTGLYVVQAIMEDSKLAKLETRNVRIQRLAEKKDFAGVSCSNALVDVGGFGGMMWVTDEGKLCQYDVPSAPLLISLSTAEEAKKAAK